MDIAIIGAGHIGGTLARRFSQLGYKVFVANSHGPASLQALAAESGATPVTVEQAARSGEVVIITIPMKSVSKLPRDLFKDVPDSVVIVDTCNYYPQQRDGRIQEIENGMPESAYVSQQIGRPVVKAFNNILSNHLMNMGKPPNVPDRIALPVAGDDPRAKQIVTQLINELGFDTVDDGKLEDSWRQQPGTLAYITDLKSKQLHEALEKTSKERKPEFKAA